MYYTVYKITNKVNNKTYVGVHKTKDLNDGYMGSGKVLKRSHEKYGLDNFEKEILFVFDNKEEMFDKEAELVNEEFVSRKDTYNMKQGGSGGFDYINEIAGIAGNHTKGTIRITDGNLIKYIKKEDKIPEGWYIGTPNIIKQQLSLLLTGKTRSKETKEKLRERFLGEKSNTYGTTQITNGVEERIIAKSDDIPEGWYIGKSNKNREIISKSQSGSGNSQYGTMFITNGLLERKIKVGEEIPEGWVRGRSDSVRNKLRSSNKK